MTVLTLFSLWLSILLVQKNGEALTYNHEPVFLVLLGDGLNRLARIGISAKDAPSEGACITGDHWYFVACWDPEKMAFMKTILVAGKKRLRNPFQTLGNLGVKLILSHEGLENICTFSYDENFPDEENFLFSLPISWLIRTLTFQNYKIFWGTILITCIGFRPI